jgi:hypothetical protein
MLGRPSRSTRKALEARGQSALAVVLEVGGHGMTMSAGNQTSWSNEVALKTRIRVEPAGEPTFEWEGQQRFWQSQKPVPGDRIWVLFDPEDHRKLMLDVSERRGALGGHLSPQANADTEAGLRWAIDPEPDGPGPPGSFGAGFSPRFSAAPVWPDPVPRIAQLADLLDRGVLTPEEFGTQKRRLLDEPPVG